MGGLTSVRDTGGVIAGQSPGITVRLAAACCHAASVYMLGPK